MLSIEQLVYGADPQSDSPSRTLLGLSAGLSREVAAEVQRFCDGWGQAPALGLRHPALLSFPLEASVRAMRGRLYAVIRVGTGTNPVFHAAILNESAFAALEYDPFRLSGTGFFEQEWVPGTPLPCRRISREQISGSPRLRVSSEDVGVVDEGLHKLMAEGSLHLPIEQSVGQSDRILALILAALPPAERKNQRMATFAASDFNRYTLAALETEGSSCAGWKRWFLAQPDAPLDTPRAAYVRSVREALIAGSLAGLSAAVRELERSPTANPVDPTAPVPVERATINPAGSRSIPRPAPLRPTLSATPEAAASAGSVRGGLSSSRGASPRVRASGRSRLVRQPVRIAQVGNRRLPSSIAMTVIFVAAAVAAYAWLSHGGVNGGFGWALLKDRFATASAPKTATLLDVVQVGKTYDRLIRKVTRSGLAGLVDSGERNRTEALATLQLEAAAPLLQQGEAFRTLAANGIQQGDRPDRESQRLQSLSEQGQVLMDEMTRLELAWSSIASGTDWRDLSDLSDTQVRVRRDSLQRANPQLLRQARTELGTAQFRKHLQTAQGHVQAMHTLLELFHAQTHTPDWEKQVYQAAERINPSASGLTRAYRNAAFVLVRLKNAERLPSHRSLPYEPVLDTAQWPSAEVRDILPNLAAQARKFSGSATPPLLSGAVSLYAELSSPEGLLSSFESAPDALSKLERNPAYRFDPVAYDDYLDRIRFESASALLTEGVDPETLPAEYFVDPQRRSDLEFRAALDQPQNAEYWEELARHDGPGFFTRWAGHQAELARADQARQAQRAELAYENSLELLGNLHQRIAQGRDWTAIWLDLRDSAETALAGARATAVQDASGSLRTSRLENLCADLVRERPLPFTAVTVRLAPDALSEPAQVRVRLRIEPLGEVYESEAFRLGPAAPAGSGWVGTAAVDWTPAVGADNTFSADVISVADGERLLQVAWESLAQRSGPAALTRPREGDAGSIRFLLDSSWWQSLEVPTVDSMKPLATSSVVAPSLTRPGR